MGEWNEHVYTADPHWHGDSGSVVCHRGDQLTWFQMFNSQSHKEKIPINRICKSHRHLIQKTNKKPIATPEKEKNGSVPLLPQLLWNTDSSCYKKYYNSIMIKCEKFCYDNKCFISDLLQILWKTNLRSQHEHFYVIAINYHIILNYSH